MSSAYNIGMKKLISGLVASTYLVVNCVLVHSTESNFWAARRTASQRVRGDYSRLNEGETVQRGNTLLAQLPSAAPVDMAHQKGFSGSNLSSSGPFVIGPKAGDWLGKLVSPYGMVKDVYLSPKKDAPFIVHIQDAHGIEEAQRNISAMIGLVGREPRIRLLGLEAAWGPFSLDQLRDFPDSNVTKEIADVFLKKGIIAGPEFAGLTLPESPEFFGAEDKSLYDDNVRALKTAHETKSEAQTKWEGLRAAVGKLKETHYSDNLKGFDAHFEAYHSETEKLAVYVRYLSKTNGALKNGISVPNLDLLIKALDEEDRLDFKRVENERRDMVEQLARKLTTDQMQDLVAKSIDYRSGRMGYGEYHAHLADTCRKHGFHLAQWGQLNRYISYVLLADKIDKNGLLEELDSLDRFIPEQLARTPQEKSLVSITYDLSLLSKLLRHEMAPADWAAYERRGSDVYRLADRITEVAPTAKQNGFSSGSLKPFEDFCSFAMKRNNALADNLLSRMAQTHNTSAVLIAGGFHTDGLTALLRKKQVSYVVLTPKINEIPEDNHYLDLLANDPVPLEKQLAGDRIFLAHVVGMALPSSEQWNFFRAVQELFGAGAQLILAVGNSAVTLKADRNAKKIFTIAGKDVYLVPKSRSTLDLLGARLVPLMRWGRLMVFKTAEFMTEKVRGARLLSNDYGPAMSKNDKITSRWTAPFGETTRLLLLSYPSLVLAGAPIWAFLNVVLMAFIIAWIYHRTVWFRTGDGNVNKRNSTPLERWGIFTWLAAFGIGSLAVTVLSAGAFVPAFVGLSPLDVVQGLPDLARNFFDALFALTNAGFWAAPAAGFNNLAAASVQFLGPMVAGFAAGLGAHSAINAGRAPGKALLTGSSGERRGLLTSFIQRFSGLFGRTPVAPPVPAEKTPAPDLSQLFDLTASQPARFDFIINYDPVYDRSILDQSNVVRRKILAENNVGLIRAFTGDLDTPRSKDAPSQTNWVRIPLKDVNPLLEALRNRDLGNPIVTKHLSFPASRYLAGNGQIWISTLHDLARTNELSEAWIDEFGDQATVFPEMSTPLNGVNSFTFKMKPGVSIDMPRSVTPRWNYGSIYPPDFDFFQWHITREVTQALERELSPEQRAGSGEHMVALVLKSGGTGIDRAAVGAPDEAFHYDDKTQEMVNPGDESHEKLRFTLDEFDRAIVLKIGLKEGGQWKVDNINRFPSDNRLVQHLLVRRGRLSAASTVEIPPAATLPGVVPIVRGIVDGLAGWLPSTSWAKGWKGKSEEEKLDVTIRRYGPLFESTIIFPFLFTLFSLLVAGLEAWAGQPGVLTGLFLRDSMVGGFGLASIAFAGIHRQVYVFNKQTNEWELTPVSLRTLKGWSIFARLTMGTLVTHWPFLLGLVPHVGFVMGTLILGPVGSSFGHVTHNERARRRGGLSLALGTQPSGQNSGSFWQEIRITQTTRLTRPINAKDIRQINAVTSRAKEVLWGLLRQVSPLEMVSILNRISNRNDIKQDDLNGSVEIEYFGYGEHKIVFKVTVGKAGDSKIPVSFLFAMKKEKRDGSISSRELEDLISLRGVGVPLFGRVFKIANETVFIEEFIEGNTAQELSDVNSLTDIHRESLARTLVTIGERLKGMVPTDATLKNFVIRESDSQAIMVDIGAGRLDISANAPITNVRLFFVGVIRYFTNGRSPEQIGSVLRGVEEGLGPTRANQLFSSFLKELGLNPSRNEGVNIASAILSRRRTERSPIAGAVGFWVPLMNRVRGLNLGVVGALEGLAIFAGGLNVVTKVFSQSGSLSLVDVSSLFLADPLFVTLSLGLVLSHFIFGVAKVGPDGKYAVDHSFSAKLRAAGVAATSLVGIPLALVLTLVFGFAPSVALTFGALLAMIPHAWINARAEREERVRNALRRTLGEPLPELDREARMAVAALLSVPLGRVVPETLNRQFVEGTGYWFGNERESLLDSIASSVPNALKQLEGENRSVIKSRVISLLLQRIAQGGKERLVVDLTDLQADGVWNSGDLTDAANVISSLLAAEIPLLLLDNSGEGEAHALLRRLGLETAKPNLILVQQVSGNVSMSGVAKEYNQKNTGVKLSETVLSREDSSFNVDEGYNRVYFKTIAEAAENAIRTLITALRSA